MRAIEHLYTKLFTKDAHEAVSSILEASLRQPFVRVGFAYFAQLEMSGWFQWEKWSQWEREDDLANIEMSHALLLNQDFLLPDGIALRLLYYKWRHPEIPGWKLFLGYKKYARASIHNLNGTDFLPYFLNSIAKRTSKEEYRLVLYGTYPEYVKKAAEFTLETFGFETVFQDGYSEFDRTLLSEDKTNILLVALGSPKQERFLESLAQELDKSIRVIAFSVGWLFDFWWGREKRAPRIVRFFSLEWLWRALTNPKKNLKKTLISFKFFLYLFR